MNLCHEILSPADWLAARVKSLGASEVASGLGLNRWESPFTLWAKKTGLLKPDPPTLDMEIGTAAQPVIARRYMRETGTYLVEPHEWLFEKPGWGKQVRFWRADYDWLRATPDMMLHSFQPVPHEIKWSRFADDIDMDHPWLVQLVAQMFCLASLRGVLLRRGQSRDIEAVEIGNAEYDVFVLRHLPKLIEFWDHVLNEDPPPIDNTESTADTLGAVFSVPQSGILIELHDSDADAIERLRRILDVEHDLDEVKRGLQNRIKHAMGNATHAAAHGMTCSWTVSERAGYLKVSPGLADKLSDAGIQYEVVEGGTTRRFNPPRRKETTDAKSD